MLYLASNSPRRKELLLLGGWDFQVVPVQVDELPKPGEGAEEYVHRIARSKAAASASMLSAREGVVVAADTTVVLDQGNGESILGKPDDAVEAEVILRSLRGRMHYVFTSLALLPLDNGELITDTCSTEVTMRNYTDQEIRAYISSGDPFDKAGAYAIQHNGFRPVYNLQGCYTNVMGLPLCNLARNLARFHLFPKGEIPQKCQLELGYDCSVYSQFIKENT